MSRLISTLVSIWRLALPYYVSEDRRAGRILLGAVLLIELSIVAITVLLNQWNARFYNALQDRNWDSFVNELLLFCGLAAAFIVLAVYQLYLNQWLQIRWRRWMTQQYLDLWLTGGNHYRMQLLGDEADNPDQRIAEDIALFIDRALSLGVGLLSAVVTLGSFVVILWTLSEAAPLQLFGVTYAIPGYLVWVALIYAVVGTVLTHIDRLAAGGAQLSPAAVRGRLPLQSGAGAGERRADRAAGWRAGGTRAAARPLQPGRRQLAGDHAAHQEAHLLHRGLHPGLDRCFRSSSSARPISPARCSSAD